MTIEAKLLAVCVGMLTFVCWHIAEERISRARAHRLLGKLMRDGTIRVETRDEGRP